MSPEEAYAAAVKAARDIRWWGPPNLPTEAILETVLASLRASGYVVVPMEPTKEMWIAASVELCYDDEFPAMVSAAPVFPPEADHG